MSSVNKVIIIGNLGADPETRYLPSGGAVTNINVATSEKWKDKNTGERQEKTEWHRIVFFDKLAEIAGEYLKKGSKVYVEGSLQTRKWQGQDGQDRYTTEIKAHQMQMLDSKGGDSGGNRGFQPGVGGGGAAPGSQGTATGSNGGGPGIPQDDFDDDVPFVTSNSQW